MTQAHPHGQSANARADTTRQPAQPAPLLATKLVRPRLPVALVARERLLRQLDAALEYPLTLLSAAAGWGKTTLLSAWTRQRSHPAAWVSLDTLDNDLTRFWSAIIAALRTVEPEAGAVALAMLHAAQPPPVATILTALLNDLAGGTAPDAPILLILDDYQVIDTPAIHEGLAFMVEHLPARLHLLLASRVDPDLPLARWRVGGRMAEIRAADLRFTAAEVNAFFARVLDDALADDDVVRLEQRTEGWVAGLQVAVLAMRQRTDRAAFVRAFTGSHRYLLDYVQEEILERQPLPVQRFLLHTAVLRRLNAAVCMALTDKPASQAMLEGLERNNLFVAPLDDERQWYRVHDLFREVLLARLQATEPELVPQLHGRAARWFAARDELREAIAHALAAGDFAYAAALIERAAPHLWLGGEAQAVHDWIGALPDGVLWQHARLALNAARRLLESLHATMSESYGSARAQVEQTIARVEALLQRQGDTPARDEADEPFPALPDEEPAVIQRRVRLLRALIATRAVLTRGDAEGLRVLAQETEELAAQEEVSWKMLALSITYWLTESIQREGALLIPRLLEAKQQAIAAGDDLATSSVMRLLTFAYARAGRLHLAHAECLEACALMEQIGEHSTMEGYLQYILSCVYYAWNRLEEAARALQQTLLIAHTWQHADLLIVGELAVAELARVQGDLPAAHRALEQAEALVRQERFATHAGFVVATRVRYWLAASDLQAPGRWAERVVFSLETWDPNRQWEFLMLMQVYLAQRRYTEARVALERFSTLLDRPGDIDTTTYFLALHAVALYYDGRREQARVVAARLLALTEPEGNIRLYLDVGEPMQRLLQSLLELPPDQEDSFRAGSVAFVSELLAAFEQEAQNGHKAVPPSQVSRPQRLPAIAEPLTRREQEVLRLLVAGASNQEIATDLVISLATVKKHVSNLLGKLQVESRAQAIARARDWSLLA